MSQCTRCGKPTQVTTMSFFNTDMICPACVKEERRHPQYAAAKQAEEAHVLAGEMNFPGVGCPPDLLARRVLVREEAKWPYPGLWPRQKPIARLRVYEADGRPVLCVVSQVDDNPGASVTNCAEKIYAKLKAEYGDCIVIEHYPQRGQFEPTYSEVTFSETNMVQWTAIHPDELPVELD